MAAPHSTGDERASPLAKRIALIGYRGSGKTSVGRMLADRMGGRFVDTDVVIAGSAGKSIAEIFADEGEAGFRVRERRAVEEAVAERPAVIALGGGAVLDDRNVTLVRTIATVVRLTAPAEVLWQRIIADDASAGLRPPLTDCAGLDEVRHMLSQRDPLYEAAADVTVDTSQLHPAQVAEVILQQVAQIGRD